MKRTFLLKTMLLLCALVAGSSSVWADYEELFKISSSSVVTNSTYQAYNTTVSEKQYVITFGGNNKSVGTNSNNRSNCNLSNNNYSKYAVSPVTTSSVASAFACKTSISDVTKISYTFNGGSNQTDTNVYLLYSSDNSTFSQVSLTSGTQGASISSGTNYEFSAKTGYFALLFVATNSSGNWRIDDVEVTFYKTATGTSVSQPTFSPVAGAVNAGTTVTLTQADADEIRYTTDGTDPTKSTGTVYESTDPIIITTPTTIKAIAVKGDDVSSIATAAYTITVAAPTFDPEGGSYLQGSTIALTSPGNSIYYTITTDGTTPSDPTTASNLYSEPIALSSGTNKIKAISVDAYGNSSSVVTRTYKGIAPAILPFSWTGTSTKGKSDLADQTGVSLSLASDYAASNAPYRLKFDDTSKYVQIYTNEKPLTVYFTAKIFGATSTGSKMKVQGSADGIDFTDIEEFTIKGSANETFEFTTSNAFAETHRVVKLILSSKDQNVGVGTISISSSAPVAFTMNAYEWSTLVSDKALDFENSGVTAYVVTGHNGNALEKTEVTTVAANTPLLLNAAAGDYEIPVAASGTAYTDNKLVAGTGVAVTKEDGKTKYVLSLDADDNIAFMKINNDAATVPADKAYLEFNEVVSAPSFSFGDATAIDDVRSKTEDVRGDFYNLNGQRVALPTKGLYIVNGKKYIVK